MTMAEKNEISHRKKAADKLILFLQNQVFITR
jgi:XTP/dITP diphosphohydrolase